MLESEFQGKLIKELKTRFPGSIVLKTDPNYIQGFPDILILWNKHWAALECKRKEHAHVQPNQEFYVDILDRMSLLSADEVHPSIYGVQQIAERLTDILIGR